MADLWVVAAAVVLGMLLWRLVSAWMESTPVVESKPFSVGDLTLESLQLYAGYDFMKPILIAIRGVVYDVTDFGSQYGPGKPLHMYAGREVSRALAKGSLKEEDCTDDLGDLTEEEAARLQAKEAEIQQAGPSVGKIVPMAKLSMEELVQYDGNDATKPMYISIQGTVFDVTQSKMYYGPDGVYPFAGKEVARAFALNSVELSDCHDDLSGLTKYDLDNLKEWEHKFRSKYHVVGELVKSQPLHE